MRRLLFSIASAFAIACSGGSAEKKGGGIIEKTELRGVSADLFFAHATTDGLFVHVGTLEDPEARWLGIEKVTAVTGRQPPLGIVRRANAETDLGPWGPSIASGVKWEVFSADKRVCISRASGVERVAYGRLTADIACFDDYYRNREVHRDPTGAHADSFDDDEQEEPDLEQLIRQPGDIFSSSSHVDIAARFDDCGEASGWLWARHETKGTPDANGFKLVADSDALASAVSAGARWQKLVKRTHAAYQGAGEELPASYRAVFRSGTGKSAYISVHLQVGDTSMDVGPDEADLWELWRGRPGKGKLIARLSEVGAKRVEPLVVGDLDGNGTLDAIVLLGYTYQDELVWFEFDAGKAEKRKSITIAGYCPS